MLTGPKALGHFRFSSQLNNGSTQFNAYQNSIFERGQVLVRKLGQNGQTPEARTRSLRGVEPRTKAICNVETTKNIVDGLVDFYNLVFYFFQFRLVSTRAKLPLCTRAHMQALTTRVGGDNLTIVCIFEGTYYGPTPNVFTHIFAPQGPKDMFMPISPIYAPFPINCVLQGLRC